MKVIPILFSLLVPVASGVQVFQLSDDITFLDGLKETLDSFRYTKNVTLNEFDCADTTMITYVVLRKAGYSPKIIASLRDWDETETSHGWIGVPDGNGSWAMVETTAYADVPAGLGLIVI
jgi:hypothetical protein